MQLVKLQQEQQQQEGTAPPPEYACSYCNYHEDPKCVARCVECNKWFCNGKGQLTVSHIIAHMSKTKHSKIAFHEESDVGADVLECYDCDGTNIFKLGLARDGDGDQLVACREPCLHGEELRGMGVDPDAWVSLIENRQVMADVCGIPNPETLKSAMCRPFSAKDQQYCEDAWKISPYLPAPAAIAFYSKNMVAKGRFRFQQLPKQFQSGQQVRSLFGPLLDDEQNRNQEIDDGFLLKDMNVTWGSLHGRTTGSFVTGEDKTLGIGRMVCFKDQHTTIEYEGCVILSETNGERSSETRYTVELARGKANRPPDNAIFTITLIFNPVTFDRMRNALNVFARDGGKGECCSTQIYETFLGNRSPMRSLQGVLPSNLNAPGIAILNDVQRRAVSEVLLRPLSLIQGPPGTGKTTTTATIVYHLVNMFKRQILVCAPSNIAVDELASRIHKTGLKVVARSREDAMSSNPEVEHLTLHEMVNRRIAAGAQNDHASLRELIALRKETGTLSNKDYDKYIVLQKRLEETIMAEADVVCCTSAVSADARLGKNLFRHVIIDESTQSHEAETLIPITKGAEQVILVGDHCQMGPVVMSRDAGEAGLSCTTFERLVKIGHKPHRLEIQYRMHPELSKFSSNMFYDGALQNGVTAAERDSARVFKWPDPTKPFFFFHTTNPEEMGSSGMSVLNRREASVAADMVRCLLTGGVKTEEIGVITPYEAQRNYLVQHFNRLASTSTLKFGGVEVASVDSFQGREKDFIILSCVRSNDTHAIGFLKDWRRMNVALTRARKGVVVIGNAFVLAEDETWNQFLLHCKTRNLIVGNSVLHLDTMDFAIPPPRRGRKTGISQETLALVRGDHAVDDDLLAQISA